MMKEMRNFGFSSCTDTVAVLLLMLAITNAAAELQEGMLVNAHLNTGCGVSYRINMQTGVQLIKREVN